MAEPVLLKFPEKVYLSGADCFHLMLENNSKKIAIGNNVIRIVFYFDDEISILPIITNIKKSPLVFWMHNISLAKGLFFQKPYWKYLNSNNNVKIKEHFSDTDKLIPAEILNRKIILEENSLIQFDVINYSSQKKALVISWHHIIMDGRGSGMLIQHLNSREPISENMFSDFFPKKERKASLFQYIKNMYEVKKFIENSSKSPISTVAENYPSINTNFKIKTIHFNCDETKQIDANAKKNGARFGANIFLIACCSHITNEINKHRGKEGVIWLPVPQDGRKRGGFGPVITNCISFLFYRLPQTDLISVKHTMDSVNQQLTNQIKTNMPKKYNMLLNMMRHIPLNLYHFLTTRSSKGVVASFLYTSAGEDIWDTNTLMNHSVNDVLIIPPSTFPPGLTFSFLRFNNTLKMNIVYCEKSINNTELELIESNIYKLILENR